MFRILFGVKGTFSKAPERGAPHENAVLFQASVNASAHALRGAARATAGQAAGQAAGAILLKPLMTRSMASPLFGSVRLASIFSTNFMRVR